MSKFLTIVSLVFSLNLSLPNTAFGQGTSTSTSLVGAVDPEKIEKTMKEYEKDCEAKYPGNEAAQESCYDKKVQKYERMSGQRGETTCERRANAFNDQIKSLQETCGNYLNGDKTLSNCLTKANSCDQKNLENLGAVSFNPDIPGVQTDVSEFEEVMKACPEIAAGDIKDWKDRSKEGRKNMDELQKDLVEEQGHLMENATKLQQDIQRLGEEEQKFADKEKELLEQIPLQTQQIDTEVQAAINDMAMRIQQENQKVIELNNRLRQAQINYSRKIASVDSTCRGKGREKYEKEKYEAFKRRPNAGNISQLANIRGQMGTVERDFTTTMCALPEYTSAKAIAAQELVAEQKMNQDLLDQTRDLLNKNQQSLNVIFQKGQDQKTAAMKRAEAQMRNLQTQKMVIQQKKQQLMTQAAQKTMTDYQKMNNIQQRLQRETLATHNANALLEMANQQKVRPNDKFNINIGNLRTEFEELEKLCADYSADCPGQAPLRVTWTKFSDAKDRCNSRSPASDNKPTLGGTAQNK